MPSFSHPTMNNEPIHDPTITLRLELGRITDQRDAFQAAFRKEVLKVVYDATLAADAGFADTVGELEAEVIRLKADLQMEKENEDRLVRNWQQANNEVHGLKAQVAALIDEQTRLKAEVERLNNNCDYLDQKLDEELEKSATLCGQVERLRKAGIAMAMCLPETDEANATYQAFERIVNGCQS